MTNRIKWTQLHECHLHIRVHHTNYMQNNQIGYIVEKQAREDLEMFLNCLPDSIRRCVEEAGRSDELLELVSKLEQLGLVVVKR